MRQETVAEIILRTCERFDKIKHLPQEEKRHLMALTEEDFKLEFQLSKVKSAG